MRTQERRYIGSEKMLSSGAAGAGNIENMLTKGYGPMFSAAAIGVVLMLIVSLFLYILSERQTAIAKMAAIEQSMLVKQQLVDLIAVSNSTLQELRIAIIKSQPITEQSFDLQAKKLLGQQRYAKSLTWSPGGIPTYTYPAIAGRSISNKMDWEVLERVKVATQSLSVKFIAQSSSKRGGVNKLILHAPLFRQEISDENNGVVSLELDLSGYFNSAVFQGHHYQLPFVVRVPGSGKSIFRASGKKLLSAGQVNSVTLPVGDINWKIRTLISQNSALNSSLIWFVAAILSAALSWLSYRIICIYKQRSVDVKAGAYRANFDLLTGLPNRYHFSRRLREVIEEAQRDQSDFAVFFMDIDYFKQMNDQLGQGAGDAILTEFAARLEFAAKNSDLVARISGDEFIFVARDVDDVIKADLLAEKIKKHLQQPIEFAGQQQFITVSLGIAMYPIDGHDVASLLHHSDQAMYAAKRAGRNQHFFFNEGMREQAEEYLAIHADLVRGLQQQEFELYYQPVLNLKTETIDICEALIRWNHPQKGLVMPDQFIPVAEKTGVIRDIGNWAFSQACRDIRRLNEGDIDVKIAINHSISEYYSSQAFERWKGILSENYVTGDKFIFEIPEALLMDKKSIRISVVNAMREMGVEFAIDDFGTGHSAINYLRTYPAEILKIDSSLIQGMQINDKDRTLVEVVLTLAKSLGKLVVAEGVENDIVAEQLKQLNCDYLQGNWLLEPIPIKRLIPYLHQHMFDLEERKGSSRRGK
ncbi:MAG: bifunctional diguanylate cyclase/phosphodiesterase [Pseudomonadales bacterium]|nr:bifunctional diguanylate cyclase/phosphodiesterase [Pseudomonadales bacterium]NRA15360.1 bifunctional diguanylate cyclase/phosphodiesterase [Oceanospirillaceae bacterium]